MDKFCIQRTNSAFVGRLWNFIRHFCSFNRQFCTFMAKMQKNELIKAQRRSVYTPPYQIFTWIVILHRHRISRREEWFYTFVTFPC